jgi:hypothetical protein
MDDPRDENSRDVDQFLLEQIDTVPHLEALLFLWNSRPQPWSVDKWRRVCFCPLDRFANPGRFGPPTAYCYWRDTG